MNIEEATMKALSGKLEENVEEKLIDVESILEDMQTKSDELYDLWVSINPEVREILDAQFEDNASISYCLRWLTQAVDDLNGDWNSVKSDLEQQLDESKEPKEEFLDPNITIAPSVDLGDGAGLGMLAGML